MGCYSLLTVLLLQPTLQTRYSLPKIERVISLLSASPVGEARCRCRKVWLTRIDYYYNYYYATAYALCCCYSPHFQKRYSLRTVLLLQPTLSKALQPTLCAAATAHICCCYSVVYATAKCPWQLACKAACCCLKGAFTQPSSKKHTAAPCAQHEGVLAEFLYP
jgi:hypothetical protein